MPEYLSPGVYVQEVNTGTRPIEGVGTAMAAFVGFAPNGPKDNRLTLITNWQQYVETFGAEEPGGTRNPHQKGSYLSHAVYGYFLNGGGRCYVARVVPPGSENGKSATLKLPSTQLLGRGGRTLPSLTAAARSAQSNDIELEVAPPTTEDAPEGTFTLKVKSGPAEEVYENVSLGKRGKGDSVRNVVETVNQTSKLIMLTELPGQGSLAERTPGVGTFSIKAQMESTAVTPVQSQHFVGSADSRLGVEGLEIADDVTMVCAPDLWSAFSWTKEASAQEKREALDKVKAVQVKMIAHAERMADRIAILDAPPGYEPKDVKTWREKESNFDSKFAALYYPWLTVDGPDGETIQVPPCGHIAGIYARNDNERGVHKAPANEVVRGVLNPERQLTKGEQDVLNPIGINCIRSFVGRGVRVWGARTLSSDPAWRYINVRRLFNYVEESIDRGTQWIVFEPNDADLWARVRRDVSAFLIGCWRDGMLFGAAPAEAFFVKCDAENNPADVRDRGQLMIDVGLAPVKPAEFVVFRFSQYAGGGA